jgi:hypothetical protein
MSITAAHLISDIYISLNVVINYNINHIIHVAHVTNINSHDSSHHGGIMYYVLFLSSPRIELQIFICKITFLRLKVLAKKENVMKRTQLLTTWSFFAAGISGLLFQT